MPELFEIVALNEDGIDKAPHPEVPYYIKAKEGDFIYRDTQIGTVLLPERKMPPLGRIGYAGGVFTWRGEKIPGDLISQAHDFFARIYQKHHAEAEVLITMNSETKEFRLFVPYQRVSHVGVKSIFEPTHISRGWDVVGTLHSHCDFSAFHSGTDSGDASDMDGVHFTIGHVNQEKPQIVAMVAMAGKEFHYQDPGDIAELDFHTKTSPEWWDQYVWPETAPSNKPKSLKSLSEEQWQEFLGRALVKPKPVGQPKKAVQPWVPPVKSGPPATPNQRPRGWVSPYSQPPKHERKQFRRSQMLDNMSWDWRDEVYGTSNESREFNRRRMRELSTDPRWGDEGQLLPKGKTGIPELDTISDALDLAEETGVFTDEDWREVAPSDVDELSFWQAFFAKRAEALAGVLFTLGLEMKYDITDKEVSK